MKNIQLKKTFSNCFAAFILCGFASTASAQIALPWHEPFPLTYTNAEAAAVTETTYFPQGGPNYPAVRIGTGNSLTLWSQGGGNGNGSPLIVGVAGLSYAGLGDPGAPQSAGVYFRTNNTTGGRSRGAVFTTLTSGTAYASFLLNVESAPKTNNRLMVILSSVTSGQPTGGPLGIWVTTNGNLALTKSANQPNPPAAPPTPLAVTASPLSVGTHLVVARYTFNGGTDDDEVAVWVDPLAATFSVSEGSVPAPTLSGTTGTDATQISSFFVFHPSTEEPAGFILDEFRVGTTWANVTPAGAVCNSASIAVSPSSQTVFEGLSATLNVSAAGTSPTYQWQSSTNGGVSWNVVAGANSSSLLTPVLANSNNGDKYRVIANVACNSSSATSSVATITVTPAVVTPDGVILDDVFADAQYNNIPGGISNSVWLQSIASTLDASSGTHLLATSQASSANWIGFFTDDSVTNQPVHLAVGKTLKVTMVFKGNNITPSGGNFRIGLFDYADGGVRPIVDGAGVGNSGANVRGYMVAINYGTSFTANPFSLYARSSLVADLMGTTGNYLGLGGGPTGYTGAPAFQNGIAYTAVFTVARTAVNSTTFSVNFTGGGTNWTHSRVDTNYAYARFDAFGIRSGSAALAADSFEISRLLVEVATGAPSPAPLNITSSGSNVTLTWTNSAFSLQAAPNVTGTYTNVPGATSPHVTPAGGAAKFFRLVYP